MQNNVIIPPDIFPYPEPHEISAAVILANHFKTTVTFRKRQNQLHTADYLIHNQIWEIKSPKGSGKRTMQNNLRDANLQSQNIIIDLRRCGLTQTQALSRIHEYLGINRNGIKRILVITKTKTVIDFYHKK